MKKLKQKGEMKKVIMFSVFSALAAGAILTIFYIINGISPFGENLILRNDALYQYNPLLVEFAERVKDGSSLLFSWQSGFGINFFGTMLYYLVNPFNFISLFFSADNMPTAFAIIILCSTMLISATTAIYLQKSFKKSDLSVIIFSLCYTFCGFYLANYYNIMWLTCFAMLPLIALGIDKITKGEKPFVYCISLSFAIISNFYLGFMLCIFSVLYFFTRLFSNPVNKKGEERVKKEKLLPVVFKFGLFSLLSGGISAITLIPTMYSMNNSYFKNSFNFKGSHFFEILDFFKVHVSGVLTNQMNPTEMVLPAVAICTIILLLVPLFFFAKKIPINEKIAHAVLLGIFVVSFEIPKVYYAWHGLSAPAGLPYRFAFIYSFILVMMAYKAFINLNDMPKWAIGVAAVLPTFCIALHFIELKKEYLTAIIVAMISTVVFVAIIALLQNVKKGSKAITAIALTCVIAEIIGVNYQQIATIEKADYKPYAKAISGLKEKLEEKDDSFYRMEIYNSGKAVLESFNGSMGAMTPSLYGYNGASQFSSLADWKFSIFQFNLGNSGNMANSFAYTMQTPIYNSLFGIKYIADTTGEIDESPYFTKKFDADGASLYENSNYLGMGYMVDEKIKEWEPYQENSLNVQKSLWETITGAKDGFDFLKSEKVDYSGCHNVSYDEIKEANPNKDAVIGEHLEEGHTADDGHHHIVGNVYELMEHMDSGKFVKFDDENDFSITYTIVPEKSAEMYFVYNTGLLNMVTVSKEDGEKNYRQLGKQIISLGYCEKGIPIKVKFTAEDCKKTFSDTTRKLVYDDMVYFKVGVLNDEAFSEGIKTIRENGVFNLTDFEETNVKGTVNAKNDGYLMMSMVYDEGWTVLVDGKETEILKNEPHMMMFPVAKGEHTIEMKYFPLGLKEGAFVSAGSILALALSVLVIEMRKERFAGEEKSEENPNGEIKE